jgi:hypothetical protein
VTPSRSSIAAGGNFSVSACAYLFAWAATLLDQFAHLPLVGDAGGLAMLLFLLLQFPYQRQYARILFIALTAIGLVGVAAAPHPWHLFLAGWRRGAAYGAFFLALSSLRDAAETSPLVRRCGQHLVAQPPGRRYAALTGGGHVFGIILSYGAIELLAAMVMRANAAAGGSLAVRTLRARRMLMAIYRGFCVMNCWSPLNLMTAVVSTAVPAAPMRALMPLAFVISLGMMGLGWLEDRLAAARRGSPTDPPQSTAESWTVHLGVVALVLMVLLLAEAGSLGLGISLVTAVTAIVPTVALGWAVIQAGRFIRRPGSAGPLHRTVAVLTRRVGEFARRVPSFRSEATVLAGSGFMGLTVGGVLPAGGIAPLIQHLPPISIPLLVPLVLIATGQIGLNPVAVVALLGAVLPDPAAVGVPPAVLALAAMLGWGLAVNMTPMSASAITTARWAGVSPWTVSTGWNAAYTASALLLAWICLLCCFEIFTLS